MLLLDEKERSLLWSAVVEIIENYAKQVGEQRVTPELDPEKLRSLLRRFDFAKPMDPQEAVGFAADALWKHQVHTPHPRYYGLFNPAPTTMGIAADTLVAAFNPQMAAWSHSPFAAEVEQHLARSFASRFGYDPALADGTFCSGGAEANHTALLTALVHSFPKFAKTGVRALGGTPVFYISSEGHHSFLKAARLCGLGTDAVRNIAVDAKFRMDTRALAEQIQSDRAAGRAPFLIVGTAGTTSAGVVDDLAALTKISRSHNLWFHADAAWGGAAALVPELRSVLNGIEDADSITFDAHKWLSVPMGAGIYLTRHPDILERTFRTDAGYMPRDAAGLSVHDPYSHSMQWSRRFTGLKVFLSLAVAGWDGYAAAIRHQTAMGNLLRNHLSEDGWGIVNDTPLPTVCFVDGRHPQGRSEPYLARVAAEIVRRGEAWISTAILGSTTPVLRACVTNYRTCETDIVALVHALADTRQRLASVANVE
jgi:glutamate/tyrosine decarboxylase-like PLP-dependent enzyme